MAGNALEILQMSCSCERFVTCNRYCMFVKKMSGLVRSGKKHWTKD